MAEFEQMEQRYEAEMEAMSTRAMHLEQENAAVHSIKSEAERAASELNEKLQCLQRTCESLREQLEFANSGEARAAELDKELREQREQEEVRAAEQQRRMDEFERSMHLQLEDMTHDMLEQREGLVEAERELKRCKREGDELERELLAERKGSESRDRAIDAERAIIKEELQSTRAMLNDAHSKLLARMDNKHAATVQAAEDRLKFTQLLRTTETALAKAQAEKVAAEREVAELRDKVKAFGAVRSELEECRLATSKHQSENEWLKNDRRSLQEQLRETAKELMIARQDLRECRMSNALASTRNQTFGRTAVQ